MGSGGSGGKSLIVSSGGTHLSRVNLDFHDYRDRPRPSAEALAGLAGALASSATPGLPTGPTIVLALSVVVVVSLGLAPERGLLWRRLRLGAKRRLPRLDPVLMHLYALSLHHAEDPEHGHSIQTLRTMSPSSVDLPATLRALEARSLARQTADGQWAPTALGRREARRLLERQGAGER